MKKIPSVFQRNYEGDRKVRDEVVPGCEWVLEGEGVPTRKFDGTSCMVREGRLYKRYNRKRDKRTGEPKPAPAEWEPAEPSPNEHTGHWPGWVPVGDGPEDQWHREAWAEAGGDLPDGTYELIGPKVQGNPEAYPEHVLIPHGEDVISDDPRTYDEIRDFLFFVEVWEGIVWHHPDGRMAKIKKRDFPR